ncbi:MAG: hypothetical protein KKF16_09775 [Euryarchaeota archaeon]|nr:hypothetical protein [Euryarchaeota archaeon]MBU4608655.1 hypothetical protein [Euryarchaeota archaeon]MBV1730532.1 hypothetical protein [Methanobacterium sp.]MBV1754290.1 hypothetical protein [Methanobacterium sp.]
MNDNSSNKISFTDFELADGYIGFYFDAQNEEEEEEEEGIIYFELTPAIKPRSDLIAIALSTLCGREYSNIHWDLNVSSSTVKAISKFTQAQVTTKNSFENLIIRKKSNNITLNFSGGFDSLSAKCLMPSNTNLVSMDFGGRFSGESEFFKKFKTCITKTNLVDFTLRKNSWSFMGIGSILFSDYLATSFQTFGGILESGPNNISDTTMSANNKSFPPFKAAGMESAMYVLGLTEVGTLQVLGHYASKLISPSLDSLASPGEAKRYRKQVLASIVSGKMEKDFGLNMIDPPSKSPFKFGQNFVEDFLSFYIIKNAGIEIASHNISDIPEEVLKLSDSLSLEFYEKLNPKYYSNFPKPLLSGLMSKLTAAKIHQYSQKDWEEFFQVREILSQYYTI